MTEYSRTERIEHKSQIKHLLSQPFTRMTFMVSKLWFDDWKVYVDYDERYGIDNEMEHPHPGPINNIDLL